MKKPIVILAYPKIDHEKNYVYFWMPFSLLTLAKPLIDAGNVEVILFDGNQQSVSDWRMLLREHLERAVCIGISIMTGGGQIGHALELASVAKEEGAKIPLIFGGPHVNVLPEQTLRHPMVDMVLIGPGQRSMPALVEALLQGLPLNNVPGLMAKNDGNHFNGPINPPRSGQLSNYPWELLNVERYIRNDPTINSRTLNYVSSQGCVYKCRFCYELTYQRKYSALSATDLIADVISLKERYNINGVKFYDADFFVDRNRAFGFAKQLASLNDSPAWAASINPNDVLKSLDLDIPLLDVLSNSNCRRLLMGVESGSDRVLAEIVKKEVTRKQILHVANEIARRGILGSYTFIIGFPGETDEEMKLTLGMIEDLWKLQPMPETRVHIFAPYPGTPLFEDALKAGFEPPQSLEAWSNYDYYRAQTPWVNERLNEVAAQFTRMTLSPMRV